ncbi:hypothetical protein RV15_GL001268 [Enterococcus silesiacus]|nr:hypothetical protein [Enterococcus silesiacus]OJG93236.1 hypothetical protein RV15_GL001268 [Enterococcus silesiacus]
MLAVIVLFSGCTNREERKEIKEISYMTSSFGVLSKAVEVNIEDATKKIFINNDYSRSGVPNKIENIPESDFEIYRISDIRKFEGKINKMRISNWKEKYVNKDIMDGYQWSLTIKYKDGEAKSIYGSNDQPKKYDELIRVLFNTEE